MINLFYNDGQLKSVEDLKTKIRFNVITNGEQKTLTFSDLGLAKELGVSTNDTRENFVESLKSEFCKNVSLDYADFNFPMPEEWIILSLDFIKNNLNNLNSIGLDFLRNSFDNPVFAYCIAINLVKYLTDSNKNVSNELLSIVSNPYETLIEVDDED